MLRTYSFLMQTDVRHTFIILLGDAGLITQIIILEGSAGGWLCTCKMRETKRP